MKKILVVSNPTKKKLTKWILGSTAVTLTVLSLLLDLKAAARDPASEVTPLDHEKIEFVSELNFLPSFIDEPSDDNLESALKTADALTE